MRRDAFAWMKKNFKPRHRGQLQSNPFKATGKELLFKWKGQAKKLTLYKHPQLSNTIPTLSKHYPLLYIYIFFLLWKKGYLISS